MVTITSLPATIMIELRMVAIVLGDLFVNSRHSKISASIACTIIVLQSFLIRKYILGTAKTLFSTVKREIFVSD